MPVSDRMRAVAALVQPCGCMADIGCDHGYVAIELIKSSTCERVIAMDINRGPLKRAMENIRACGLQSYIETRLSDGAAALVSGEADGIICAGMGGRLVISVLDRRKELIRGMKQLILQPQSELGEVRRYLRTNGYVTEKEDMILEDGKYYPMMRVRYSESAAGCEAQNCGMKDFCAADAERLSRVQDTYGAFLLRTAHPVLREYLLYRREKLCGIRDGLRKAERMSGHERIFELTGQIEDITFCLDNYFS